MTRRLVIVLVGPTTAAPPGIDAVAWRAALAEDVVDLVSALDQVDAGILTAAADAPLAAAVAWPQTRRYAAPRATVSVALELAAADGYQQVAIVAADVPDLPGLLVGKLFRPLSTRPVVVGSDLDGHGLWGLACQLPAPDWLPDLDLDSATADQVGVAAPRRGRVAVAPPWRRSRGAVVGGGGDAVDRLLRQPAIRKP